MPPRRLLAFLLGSLFLPSAVADAAPAALQAALTIEQPLQTSGLVRAAIPSTNRSWDLRLESPETLDASAAAGSVVIRDRDRLLVAGQDVEAHRGRQGQDGAAIGLASGEARFETTKEIRMRDATLTLRPGPEAHLAFAPTGAGIELGTFDAAPCTVWAPGIAPGVDVLRDKAARALVGGITVAPVHAGHIRCTSQHVGIQGHARILVSGAHLELTFTDANDGRRRSLSVEARPEDEESALGVRDRQIELNLTSFQLSDRPGGRPGVVHARLPGFAWSGALRLPPSQGSLHWGETRLEGSIRSLTFDGSFALRFPDLGAVTIEGVGAEARLASPSPPMPSMHGETIAAVAVLALGVAAWMGRRFLVACMFTRVTRHGILDHARRTRIAELLRARPGLTMQQMVAALGISRGVLRHHLTLMERTHVVRRQPLPVGAAYFLTDAPRPAATREAILLRGRSARRVAAVLAIGAQTQREIARRSGLSQSRVSEVLKILAMHGLITARVEGRTRRYGLTVSADNALPWV